MATTPPQEESLRQEQQQQQLKTQPKITKARDTAQGLSVAASQHDPNSISLDNGDRSHPHPHPHPHPDNPDPHTLTPNPDPNSDLKSWI